MGTVCGKMWVENMVKYELSMEQDVGFGYRRMGYNLDRGCDRFGARHEAKNELRIWHSVGWECGMV